MRQCNVRHCTAVNVAECKTKQNQDCVFPFTYKGETYNSCTNAGSENGAAWCATQVV